MIRNSATGAFVYLPPEAKDVPGLMQALVAKWLSPWASRKRMARNLLQGWVNNGLLVVVDASKRKRAYGLSAIYRQYIGSLTAMTPE